MTVSSVSLARGLTVVVVGAFLGVLGLYLGEPGYSQSRLLLFAALGGVAVAGAAGIVLERERLAAGGVCGLLLLGVWQAALWIYIFPVAGVLTVAAVVVSNHERTGTPMK